MSKPRCRQSNTRKMKSIVFVMGDGDSEKTYFEKLNQTLRNTRIRSNELGKSGWNTILKKCKGHKSAGDVDLKHGDRLVIVTDEDHRYDEDTIRKFQKKCEEEGFELFLSNVSFETWLLMHYEPVAVPYEQEELEERLKEYLGGRYCKSEGIPMDEEMIRRAIKHADQVLSVGDNIDCFKNNPSTRVHMLVKGLMDDRNRFYRNVGGNPGLLTNKSVARGFPLAFR